MCVECLKVLGIGSFSNNDPYGMGSLSNNDPYGMGSLSNNDPYGIFFFALSIN